MSSLDEQPVFTFVTSEGRVCEKCKYDLPEEGFLACSLLCEKPSEVINNDECPYFVKRKEKKN